MGTTALSAPVCDVNILDLLAKHDLSVLTARYQEALKAVDQPELLEPAVLQQCKEAVTAYASAIRLFVKKLEVSADHALSQARDNLYALEQQQAEVWQQYKKLPEQAAPEATKKLQSEWETITTQVRQVEAIILQLMVTLEDHLASLVKEQKQTILSQHEALRQQRQQLNDHEKQHKRSRQTSGSSPPSKGGAFSKVIVSNVLKARDQAEGKLEPATAPLLLQGEQEQLAYQFEWENFDRILQEDTRLSTEKPAIRWTSIKSMQPSKLTELFPSEQNNDVVLAVHYSDLQQLSHLGIKCLDEANIDRCDILVLTPDDLPMFPHAGPTIEKQVPWHLDEVCKLSRPLSVEGGGGLHGFVALSTKRGRLNHLAPTFSRRKLLAEGLGALQVQMELPQSEKQWFAITAEDRAIPGILHGLGRTGPACVSNPHKNIKGVRIVWHQLNDEDRTQITKAYKSCPYFSVSREEEHGGEEMHDCPLVLQFYPKATVRQSLGPFLWHAVHNSLSQHLPEGAGFSIQLAARAKVRVGMPNLEQAQAWLLQAKFELEVMGLNIKK